MTLRDILTRFWSVQMILIDKIKAPGIPLDLIFFLIMFLYSILSFMRVKLFLMHLEKLSVRRGIIFPGKYKIAEIFLLC